MSFTKVISAVSELQFLGALFLEKFIGKSNLLKMYFFSGKKMQWSEEIFRRVIPMLTQIIERYSSFFIEFDISDGRGIILGSSTSGIEEKRFLNSHVNFLLPLLNFNFNFPLFGMISYTSVPNSRLDKNGIKAFVRVLKPPIFGYAKERHVLGKVWKLIKLSDCEKQGEISEISFLKNFFV
ncbi:MAG: hypothetical protein QXT63_01355 [Thermoplasmata archaeon]